ncbi:hypothetical protein MFLAVUS_003962 [Mucor flavus]|uniref:Uncharacterized protein n=1 Tax=Mucor flavus TaxID=439312 RepID=A0ABP9YUJ9_9FUNG
MTGALKSLYPHRKITRFCWIVIATAFLGFWTYFLYCYTNEGATLTGDYEPTAFKQKTVIKEDVTLFTNMQKQQLQQGHSGIEIDALLSQIGQTFLNKEQEDSNKKPVADLTVLVQATTKQDVLESQINAILLQSVQPKSIHILYSDASIKETLKWMVQSSHIPITFIRSMIPIINKEFYQVRDASWLVTQPSSSIITTEYTWILEPYIIPETEYIYSTYGLLKTNEYKSTLIGYQAAVIHTQSSIKLECFLSSKIATSRKVDMIHGSWFLHTSWLHILHRELDSNALDLPLAYFISNSLLYGANINSVIIPSKLKPITTSSFCSNWNFILRHTEFRSVLPHVADRQRISQAGNVVMVLLHGYAQAFEFMPLVCKLLQHQQIHVILTDGLLHTTFQDLFRTLACQYSDKVFVHDLSAAYNRGGVEEDDYTVPVTRLLKFIRPQVLLQLKDNENSFFYRAIETASQVMNITSISLPTGQVNCALWISDLSVEALQLYEYELIPSSRVDWHSIKLDLVVITDRRPESLSRLLTSLNQAYYLGDDTMELLIHMEQSADRVTQQVVESFDWKHGPKMIRHRIRKGGLMPAIIESWYPSDNHHYGVLLEDDIELSPLFYVWAKYNILKYRYSSNETDAYQHVYGVSLYSPRNLELLPAGRVPFDPSPVLTASGYDARAPYATQIPCSWGAVYFPEHWRMFHTYLTSRIEKDDTWKGYYNITVPGSRSSNWKKSWKKYFIELTYLRAYVMIYPNFKGFESFSTNHLEYGTHVKDNGRTESKVSQFLVPLMQRDTILEQLPENALPRFEQMPVMDLWGKIKTVDELDQVAAKWHKRVSTCQRKPESFDPSDLLCPFEENILKATRIEKKH